MLTTAMKPVTRLVERWMPSAMVFAVLLTLIVMLMALTMTDSSPVAVVNAWGEGLTGLLAFITQMCLALLFGHALAHTRQVQGVLSKVSSIPKNAVQAYAWVTLLTCLVSWAQWSLGLIVGAILAKSIATSCRERGIKVHFPLLVAAAYTGFIPYHMGYSGAAPLTSATPGSFIEEFLGAPVPVTETVFSWWNMTGLLIMIPALVIGMVMSRPKTDEEILEIPLSNPDSQTEARQAGKPESPADWIESKRYVTTGLGLLLSVFIVGHFMRLGFVLTFDIVNWSMLAIILLLVDSPVALAGLIKNASTVTGEVLLQYPLYAGILGIVTTTGLITVLSDAFISMSNANSLPIVAFLAAGLVNIFVPSGGGQFAIQGPIFIEAANALGTDPALIIMAIGYGDTWTNMIQPFFALPILAIAGLGVRSILKYTFVSLVISGAVFLFILLLPTYIF